MAKAKKSAVILMFITLISKITGFVRDIILAQSFGASMITDAYLTALNIPVVLFDGISSSLGTTYIPMFFKIREEKGDKEVDKFTSNILNIAILLSIGITIIAIIFTPYIVKIFAIGFKGEEFILTVRFSRILIFSMIFIAINGLVASYLIANGKFYISGLVTIPFNIFCIISIVIGGLTNSNSMVIGTLIAYIAQLLFQLPFLFKAGYKHSLKIDLKDNNIRRILYLIFPVFVGSYANQINTVVNRTLASTLDSGSITALNYANKLNIFAVGILVISISTVMYPILSKLASEKNIPQFKSTLLRSINIVIIVMLPIMIGMMILSVPIVKILFEEGSFDSHDTYLTSTALFYYSIGIVGFGIRDMISRAFYSLQDTKTPVKNAIIAVFVNIFCSIIFVKILGIGGLALSASISSLVGAMLLIIDLRKKLGNLGLKSSIITLIKSIIASIIMGIIVIYVYKLVIILGALNIYNSRYLMGIGLIISVTIGIIVYYIINIILRVDEVLVITKQFKNKFIYIFNKKRKV